MWTKEWLIQKKPKGTNTSPRFSTIPISQKTDRLINHILIKDTLFLSCDGLSRVEITTDVITESDNTDAIFSVVHFKELQTAIDEMDQSDYMQSLKQKIDR